MLARKQPANAEQSRALGINRGTRVVILHRLPVADGEAIAWETTVLRHECERVPDANLEHGSLHCALRDLGHIPSEGRASIRAEGATAEDATPRRVLRFLSRRA